MNTTDYWSIVETVWYDISIYDGPNVFLTQFSEAPLAARLLFAAHWCQSEIRNGGFKQFFENSTGVLAPEAIEAFAVIGMPLISSVISQATSLFGEPYPRAKSARAKIIRERKLKNELDRFDDRFFELIESEAGGFIVVADEFATKKTS